MTTTAKAAANKRNAARSTGPRTMAGKTVAKLNATTHGLRAASPVVPGEDPEGWDVFQNAIVSDLAPVGALETELAERVASLSWRLRRVSAFEAAVVTQQSDEAAQQVRGEDRAEALWLTRLPTTTPTVASLRQQTEELKSSIDSGERLGTLIHALTNTPAGAPFAGDDAVFVLVRVAGLLCDDEGEPTADPTDPHLLSEMGVPLEAHERPERWSGWTADVIQRGMALVALSVGGSSRQLLALATTAFAADLRQNRAELAATRKELKAAERRAKVDETAARRRALVATNAVDVVVKYEGHLQRQLAQTLHELERRQALRSDCPPHPPVAVDVTLHATEDGVTTLLPFKE